MDKQEYIDNLKKTDLRPDKIKVEEYNPVILNEQDAEDKMDTDLHNSIISWFMEHPNPMDSDVHAFAQEMGINEHEFENHIYMILSNILTEGRSKGKDHDYNPQQVQMGIEVEMEHTTIPKIAEKIVWDHLEEIPDYYDRLSRMEKEAGAI